MDSKASIQNDDENNKSPPTEATTSKQLPSRLYLNQERIEGPKIRMQLMLHFGAEAHRQGVDMQQDRIFLSLKDQRVSDEFKSECYAIMSEMTYMEITIDERPTEATKELKRREYYEMLFSQLRKFYELYPSYTTDVRESFLNKRCSA